MILDRTASEQLALLKPAGAPRRPEALTALLGSGVLGARLIDAAERASRGVPARMAGEPANGRADRLPGDTGNA